MKIGLFLAVPQSREYVEGTLHPLGLLYLVSYLQKNSTINLDFKYTVCDYEKALEEFKPDIVFISSVTPYWNIAVQLAKMSKGYGCDVIVGGPHITALPTCLTKHMDVAVLGEGEETILDLLNNRISQKVKGIEYRKNNELVITERRQFIKPLDNIPFPNRTLITVKKNYWTGMITSRGCPFNCIFCSPTRFWGKVRFHSAKYVVDEITEIAEVYDGNRIVVVDDLFTLNKKRLTEIVNLLKKENLDVEFQVNGRANLITDNICKLLKDMNVIGVDFGFESNTREILKYLKGEGITPEDNERAVKLCKKYKLDIYANIVIGSPQETKKEILKTLKFVKGSLFETLWVYPLTPLPATPLWEYAKSRGLVSDDMDFNKLDLAHFDKENGIILSEVLGREEFVELYEIFIKEANKIKRKHLLKEGLKHPSKIPRFIGGKIRI